jgi:hypothetical protein
MTEVLTGVALLGWVVFVLMGTGGAGAEGRGF